MPSQCSYVYESVSLPTCPKYSGALPARHLILQPMLGFCSAGTGLPASTASTAARRSAPVTGMPESGRLAVHLAAVDQLLILVEQEEIGRAGGMIRFGHFLRFVVEIRKRIAAVLHFVDHLLGRIGRIAGRVVGTDSDHRHASGLIIAANWASPPATCFTYGQWLHMKITNSAGWPAKSASETVWPSTFGSEKSGAFVPKGNIVLGVRTMIEPPSC